MAAGAVEVNVTNIRAFPCASFDGINDYVDCGNDTSLQLVEMSISFWFCPKTNDDGIITKGLSRSINANKDWDIFGDGTKLRFIVSDGTNNILDINGATFPTLNEWHHIVATWDGTTGADGGKIYINGVLVDTATASAINLTNTHSLRIGGEGGYSYTGALSKIKIFDRVITTEEIANIYACIPVSEGLIGEWNLYKDYKDTSGTGNDGTNSGSILTIADDAVSAAIAADRTTANDKYLMVGVAGQIVSAIIEEAP